MRRIMREDGSYDYVKLFVAIEMQMHGEAIIMPMNNVK